MLLGGRMPPDRWLGSGPRPLSCLTELPQGALVWIMEGDARSVPYGETARIRGVRGFHNQALVHLPIG